MRKGNDVTAQSECYCDEQRANRVFSVVSVWCSVLKVVANSLQLRIHVLAQHSRSPFLTSHQAMLTTSTRQAVRKHEEGVNFPLLNFGIVEASRKLGVRNRVCKQPRDNEPKEARYHPAWRALREEHYHVAPNEHRNALTQHRRSLLPLDGGRICWIKNSSWSTY